MDARLYLLKTLITTCRQRRLDDLTRITWNDVAVFRACAVRLEHGDSTAWRTVLDRLRASQRLAAEARHVLQDVGLVRDDCACEGIRMGELPDGITPLAIDDEAALLATLDVWGPDFGKGDPFPAPIAKPVGQIMYIEQKPGLSGHARIGRVRFSQTRKTLYYKDRRFQSLKGYGYKANFFDFDTEMWYWISKCRKDGRDTLYPGVIEIDDDARAEYWLSIRKLPERVGERSFRSEGKYAKRRPC